MKKTLLAVGVLGAFSTMAFAASNVTLYGIIDASVVVGKASGDSFTWKEGNAATFEAKSHAKNDATVSMGSGFRSGNRWGIKGVEDLGNGNSVGFVLEQGFNINNGTEGATGLAFNRESTLRLKGNFGEFVVGRVGTLSSGVGMNILTGWALGTTYTSGSWNAYEGTLRANNAIAYRSPSFGGLQVTAMYSNGIATDTSKWSQNQHYYGIGAKYVGGPLVSSFSFEVKDNKGSFFTDPITAKASNIKQKSNYQINFGAEYDLGALVAMFAYRYEWQSDYADFHTFGLSAKAPLAGGTLKAGARYHMGKLKGEAKELLADSEDKGNVWTLNAAYEYPLSKRTTVWGYGGYAHGGKGFKKEYNAYTDYIRQAGGANMGKQIYFNGYQCALGITHSF